MDIREKLRNHINMIFQDAPQTRNILELKEELLANSIERYTDLTLQGRVPEEAYQNVISNIGNVDELIAAAKADTGVLQKTSYNNKKVALVRSVAVGLYILAGIVLIAGAFVSEFSEYAFWGCLLGSLFIAAIPTIMLVYMAAAYPNYEKKDDSVVENFKEWNTSSSRNSVIAKAVKSTMWLIIVCVYLLISFFTNAWGLTWIIFPFGAAIQGIIDVLFKLREIN